MRLNALKRNRIHSSVLIPAWIHPRITDWSPKICCILFVSNGPNILSVHKLTNHPVIFNLFDNLLILEQRCSKLKQEFGYIQKLVSTCVFEWHIITGMNI